MSSRKIDQIKNGDWLYAESGNYCALVYQTEGYLNRFNQVREPEVRIDYGTIGLPTHTSQYNVLYGDEEIIKAMRHFQNDLRKWRNLTDFPFEH